jgi:hypothetical protein
MNRMGSPQDALRQNRIKKGTGEIRLTLQEIRNTGIEYPASGIEVGLKVFLSRIYLTAEVALCMIYVQRK